MKGKLSSRPQTGDPLYRYERKFLIEEMSSRQVQEIVRLHPALFTRPFPPRYINNIYLDTPDLDNYHANVNGDMQRHKVRIRWYGELFREVGKPVLEIKIKEGLVGHKLSFALASFDFRRGSDKRHLKKLLRESSLPPEILEKVLSLEPVLLNRYYRWYYATPCSAYRTTVDTDLTYYQFNPLGGSFRNKSRDRAHTIVELKYSIQQENSAGRIAAALPFPMTRSSKYIMGVERVYL